MACPIERERDDWRAFSFGLIEDRHKHMPGHRPGRVTACTHHDCGGYTYREEKYTMPRQRPFSGELTCH